MVETNIVDYASTSSNY